MTDPVLVLDAGTTNIKALAIDRSQKVLGRWVESVQTLHPQPGWVEQDAEQILALVEKLAAQAVAVHPDITAVGLTNQRETTVLWDANTGRALHPAIVWEDDRTASICQEWMNQPGLQAKVRENTGLDLKPYFSASKMKWLLQNVDLPKAYKLGTIDSWLMMRLTGQHVTDMTNAARTLLFDIRKRQWDPGLAQAFGIDTSLLPEVKASFSDFGSLTIGPKTIPIRAILGDQQASLYAAGNTPGIIKATLGTGIFPMKLVGPDFISQPGFYTTLAVGESNQPVFALETYIKDAALRVSPVLDQPEQLELVMKSLATEASQPLLQLIDESTKQVVVDGGISQNDTIVAELARLCGRPVVRLAHYEGTALGVAKLIFDNIR
ncbi:MAG TPA: FGGY family carbohydrate kinase [Candidatus Saccharimonadales bacterium]|nr:FGGY family carbohydrate kinase [Candidatus Saccharimonadales bacterium]